MLTSAVCNIVAVVCGALVQKTVRLINSTEGYVRMHSVAVDMYFAFTLQDLARKNGWCPTTWEDVVGGAAVFRSTAATYNIADVRIRLLIC